MTIAEQLAKRIVTMEYDDLPTEAIRWAKISFIDTIGCAFAGVDEEAPQRLRPQASGCQRVSISRCGVPPISRRRISSSRSSRTAQRKR